MAMRPFWRAWLGFGPSAWQARGVESDVVNLSVPARPRFGQLIRVTGANMAARLGWSLVDIDQLRVALEASTDTLLGPLPKKGSLNAAFAVVGEALNVELGLTDGAEQIPNDRVQSFHEAVDSCVDSAKLDPAAARVFLTKSQSLD